MDRSIVLILMLWLEECRQVSIVSNNIAVMIKDVKNTAFSITICDHKLYGLWIPDPIGDNGS